MRFIIIIFLLIGSVYVKGQILSTPIYKDEIIYVFKYSIYLEGNLKDEGVLYMGCLGNTYNPPKGGPQYLVTWTTDKKLLDKRIQSAGVIETSNKIYLHPPRQNEFSILEYSPFPEIHFPISKGLNWTKKLALGKHFVNEKYNMTADKIILFEYKYQNTQPYKLRLNNKMVDCYYIYANTTNTKPQTSFSGLFNTKYGFVKMIFKNIDDSILILELDGIENWNKDY